MIIIDDIEQGTAEWVKAKLGKPSASNFSKVITASGKQSATRQDYLDTLAAEIIRGQRYETYKNGEMQEGNDREEECIAMYSALTGEKVRSVALIYPDEERKILCSPDALCDGSHGVEAKNVIPKTQIRRLRENRVPPEYVIQIQFSLFVTQLDRWDFFSYCPDLPTLLLHVKPDPNLQTLIKSEVKLFCAELEAEAKRWSL
jgi:hypothetical protein